MTQTFSDSQNSDRSQNADGAQAPFSTRSASADTLSADTLETAAQSADLHPDFRIATHDSLRDSELYQQIRHEVNRRRTPLSGAINWSQIGQLCQQLMTEQGTDLLIAVYFTVAQTKCSGISGLADGLELQLAVMACPESDRLYPRERRAELYRWMTARLTSDIRDLAPDLSQLRDFYRCERACQLLHERFSLYPKDQQPDLEAVGFEVFHHLDKLEQRCRGQIQIRTEQVTRTRLSALVFTVGLILGIGPLLGYDFWQQPEPIEEILLDTRAKPVVITATEIPLALMAVNNGWKTPIKTEAKIATAYTDYMDQLKLQPPWHNSLLPEAISNSFLNIYPGNDRLNNYQHEILQSHEDQIEVLDTLNRRFIKARTRAANLQQTLQSASNQANWNQARRFSVELEEYAIGLSPVLARNLYIDDQIKQGNLTTAREELAQQAIHLNALLYDAARISQRLEAAEKEGQEP